MRRTRFHFTAEHDTRPTWTAEILAYSKEDVFRWLERKGYYSIEVGRAPYRKNPAAAKAAAWEIDPAGLKALCVHMGVTWNVEIRRTASRTHAGIIRSTHNDFGRRHRICVDKTLTPKKASEIIAHELKHAQQMENAQTWGVWMTYRKRQHKTRYANRPMEIEARAAEAIGPRFMPARSVK